MEWLYGYSRQVVQVFLVVGGYLAAQSVMDKPITRPLVSIVKRYLRLVPFYVLALLLISVAVAVSRDTIHAAWLPSEPNLWQFLTHALLLHDLLGFEALSSGVWYVAIDFQLYALLMVLCYALQTENHRRLSVVVALLCAASMWQFNRVDELDMWAIYFFAAYGLGVLAAWAKRVLANRGASRRCTLGGVPHTPLAGTPHGGVAGHQTQKHGALDAYQTRGAPFV
jgi:peptidoglycan/LPS O-acetylase OafA/YrhL